MSETFYPLESQNTPHFSGIRTFMRLPHQEITHPDFLLMGVPFDTAVSFRVGARFGPQALREASLRLQRYHSTLEVNILEQLQGIDYGDLRVIPGNTERSHEMITQALQPIVEKGVVPLLMGGDHSITLPELRAVKAVHGPVAVIQFDAHHDTWKSMHGERFSHASPMIRALEEGLIKPEKSILLGMRGSTHGEEEFPGVEELGFQALTTPSILKMGQKEVLQRVRERVGQEKVFLTFDIDVVDPAYAPGTGTPVVGGLTSREVLFLVEGLTHLNYIGFDMVEILPSFDQGEITALLGATLIHTFLALMAKEKKNRD